MAERTYLVDGSTTVGDGATLDAYTARTLMQDNSQAVYEEARDDHHVLMRAYHEITQRDVPWGPVPIRMRLGQDGKWRTQYFDLLCAKGGAASMVFRLVLTDTYRRPQSDHPLTGVPNDYDPYCSWTVSTGTTTLAWRGVQSVTVPRDWAPSLMTRGDASDGEQGTMRIAWATVWAMSTLSGDNPRVGGIRCYEYAKQETSVPTPPEPMELIYELLCTTTGDGDATDRLGWAPLDDISGSIVLDWADGDGTTPDVGPDLTKVGTVTAGKATPWRDPGEIAITCSEFATNSCYYAAAGSMDPDNSDDIIMAVLFRSELIDYRQIFALRRTAPTVDGYWCSTSASYNLAWAEASAGAIQGDILTSGYDNYCWILLSVTKNRSSGYTYLYVNGALADSADNDTASWGTNLIPVIGALDSSATNPITGDIARIVVAHGSSLAATCDATWHASLAEHVFGLLPSTGTAGTTYARTTSAIYYPTGDPDVRVHLLSANCPPCGNSEGYGPDEQIVSFAEKNYAFVAGDDATYGGFDFHEIPDASWGENHTNTDTISDDSSDLATHGLRECGPNALHFELWIEIFGID